MSRIRDNGVDRVAIWTTMNTVPPMPPQLGSANFPYRDHDQMQDVVSIGFKRRSRQGEVINNPMERLKSVYKQTNLAAADSTSKWFCSHEPYHGSRISDPWNILSDPLVAAKVERVESLAITEAYAAVGEPNVESLTELAELRETIAFLSSPVKGMVNLTQRGVAWLKRYEVLQAKFAKRQAAYQNRLARWTARGSKGQRPVAPTPPKIDPFRVGRWKATDIPSFWLAYRYGIMPLIYSFQGIQKNLQEQIASIKPIRATARKKRDEKMKDHMMPMTSGYTVNNASVVIDRRLECDGRVISRAGVLYEFTLDVQTKWGLHLHYVPVALYETIPLSFVADWFWTGSDAYKALTAHLRADSILAAWVKTRLILDATEVDYCSSPSTDVSVEPSVRPYGVHEIEWNRRRPASQRDVRIQLKIDLNLKRVADGLALVTTLLDSAVGRKRR